MSKSGPWYWRLVGILILAFGVLGFMALRALRPEPVITAALPEVPLVETAALELRHGPIWITGSGLVRPRAEVTLSAQVSGQVVYVSPALVSGGSFEEGETLLRVDARAYAAEIQQAEASKRAAEARIDFLDKQIQRSRSLSQSGVLSQERLEERLSQFNQTRAEIDRLIAVIDRRRLDLEHATLRAPFAGRVLSENVDVGDVVRPGQELGRIYAGDLVEIVVPLNDGKAALIPGLWRDHRDSTAKPRARVTVRYGGRDFRWLGYADRAEAGIDPQTRTIDIVVQVPRPFRPGKPLAPPSSDIQAPPPLLIGMFASVAIEGVDLKGHYEVPRGVLREGGKLWTVAPDNTLHSRSVSVVREDDGLVVLQSFGLREGTLVVTNDLAVVTEGMRVRLAGVRGGS